MNDPKKAATETGEFECFDCSKPVPEDGNLCPECGEARRQFEAEEDDQRDIYDAWGRYRRG